MKKKKSYTLNVDEINEVLDLLEREYPDAECALNFSNMFQLIVAVALSAQTTDKSVNKVTPDLFSKYPSPYELAEAHNEDVEDLIKKIGMYKTKAKNIIGMAEALVKNHGGEVPDDYDELVKLPGVGRKTANVVLSVGFGQQRIAVDTHVFRVANRIGLCHEDNVLKTELALMNNIDSSRWSNSHHSLIFHGRNCCIARNPKCDICPVKHICKYVNG